ncbi:MAG: hypothetical protein HKN47_13680 [Pirellulaceae bacterium]|nr:hypothetical protein [Pirellulaceae bacterium]
MSRRVDELKAVSVLLWMVGSRSIGSTQSSDSAGSFWRFSTGLKKRYVVGSE